MEGVEGDEGKKVFLAMCNGVGFEMNDLVDVFVGTVKGVRGNKSSPIKGRFKGVRVEQGQERFLCRPIVGSQKGRCPSFPPESCLQVKAFGSDVYGERRPLHFSKLKREVQDRFTLAPHPYPHDLPIGISPPPPSLSVSYLSLMIRANTEVMVRTKKVENSLKLVKRKAAKQVQQR